MTPQQQNSKAAADPVILVEGLTKTFGSFHALNGLDLEVARGEVHGFLGPNGAGKSTTIRILLGLLRATSGRAELVGRDAWTDALGIHVRLAYVPGDVPLWPSLTGGQCIDILTDAQGTGSAPHRSELIERFDLDPIKRTREYSNGNRQKVALSQRCQPTSIYWCSMSPRRGSTPSRSRSSRRSSGSAAHRAAPCFYRATSSVKWKPWPTG